MIEIEHAYRLINILAFIGATIGFSGLVYLQLYRDECWPLQDTVPLLGTSFTLAVIGSGYWFSGPLAAVVTRAIIVVLLVIVVFVLLRPLYLLRQ